MLNGLPKLLRKLDTTVMVWGNTNSKRSMFGEVKITLELSLAFQPQQQSLQHRGLRTRQTSRVSSAMRLLNARALLLFASK
jgi:hypothetical protein